MDLSLGRRLAQGSTQESIPSRKVRLTKRNGQGFSCPEFIERRPVTDTMVLRPNFFNYEMSMQKMWHSC